MVREALITARCAADLAPSRWLADDEVQATDDARNLRARFPRWGILFDPVEGVWVAVRGKRMLVTASSPDKLTRQVEAAARGEAGPDEADKTRTWRVRRNYGRR
jgi:hypothetical protein